MTRQEQLSRLQTLLEKSNRIGEGIKQEWWQDVETALRGQQEALKNNLIWTDDEKKSADIKAEIRAINRLFDIITYFVNSREQLLADLKEVREMDISG